MRLREKTLELNFCTQLETFLNRRIIWFGLTQKQEAKAGFDACTRLGARLFLFQFKASAYILRSGVRQFVAEHDQMQKLRDRCAAQRIIFYVFPMIGTTHELVNNPDLMSNTWLLDVMDLPTAIPAPVTSTGSTRKSKLHYVDVMPPIARIHSDPFQVKLGDMRLFKMELFQMPDGGLIGVVGDNFDRFYDLTRDLFRTSKAAGIL